MNLIDGSARGTVLLYRYADVFFCGCTPELLVRKRGNEVESMCLAGTCPAGATEEERARLADELMADAKNRAEHDHVVRFIREVFNRTCYDVDVPAQPGILPLTHVQHLCTPARARMLEGVDLGTMKDDLHPTPAVAGTPVGEAQMLIRSIEAYNRAAHRRVRRRGGLGVRRLRHRRGQRGRRRVRRNRHEAEDGPVGVRRRGGSVGLSADGTSRRCGFPQHPICGR